jgi:hypothetical protein
LLTFTALTGPVFGHVRQRELQIPTPLHPIDDFG